MSETFPITFGRYQLVERLAVGGMAELFKARVVGAHGFQKPVVIKKILPHLAADASFVAMFIDEANITARLDHPKIAQVLELGTIDDQLYIAMEFVEGMDTLALLRACAHAKKTLPTQLAVHIAHEVLDALDYAHRARDLDGQPLGIVHRDISPSNVLISRRGDVKLADFGIAHAVERQQKTQAGTLKGKYGYMSPEQVVGGDIDGRSDLFSVGIVLAEMLMGRRLFTAPNELDVLLMVRDVRLERLEKYGAAIEADLRVILEKALAREVKDRYVTAGAFRDALGEWLFSKRQRVGPSELAGFVEPLLASAPDKPRAPTSSPGSSAAPAPTPAPTGTLVGPSTKAKQLQAEEQARLARAEVAARKASGGGGSAPTPTPTPTPAITPAPAVAKRPASVTGTPSVAKAPRAPTVPASPAAVRVSSEIPITLDLGETDPSQGAVIAMPLADGESGPIVIIEHTPSPLETLVLEEPPEDRPVSSPPAQVARGTERAEVDFADVAFDVGLSTPAPAPPRPVAGAPSAAPAPPVTPPGRMNVDGEKPDQEGELAKTQPIRILYKLAIEKQTGLLVVEISGISKDIFFAGGVPEFVSSNVARELFGEYLVAQKVITHGELSMALAMMPHFGGKLGDTLVGLGLMKPLDVFRHLTRQVRDKIIDVCTWQKGNFRWYRGKRNPREAFPLGLDAFEVLGAGATALTRDIVEAWVGPVADKIPLAAKNPRVVPEAFRLGTYPRDVYNRLDGRLNVREFAARFTNPDDRLAFLRTLYLLVQTELAFLS